MSKKKQKKPGYSSQLQSLQFNKLKNLYLQALQLQQQGYLSKAEMLYREILDNIPDQPDALHYLGMIYMDKGDNKLAEDYIRKSIKSSGNPIYFSNYGLLLSRQRKYEQAVEQFKKAVVLQPGYAEAWYNLGAALSDLGRLSDAEDAYKKAISCRKDYIKALYGLACVQVSQSKSAEAKETINLIQAVTPDTADVFYKLAQALQFLGGSQNIRKAYEYFRKAMEIEPYSLEIRNAYARLLTESNYIEAALEEYRNILAVEPEYQNVRLNFVHNLVRDEQIKAAEKELSQILKQSPENIQALIGMGNIHRINGNFSDAEMIYNKILTLDELNDGALFGIASGRKFTDENDSIINKLNKAIEKNQTSFAYYALGKIYNDLGNYDLAFTAYKKANEIKNNRIDYNHIEHSAYVDSIINIFTKECVDEMQTHGNDSELPIFIIGTPRSGTTLTEQIISSHPMVVGAGELKFINHLARNKLQNHVTDKKYPERIADLTPEGIQKEAGIYLEKIKNYQYNCGVLRITDKMPANFFNVGYIFILFPRARVIHCRRNPLDSCLSIYFQAFQASQQYSFDLENLGYWYKDYLRLMQHWKRIFGDRILDVDYDATVNDTETTARKLIEFCGLEWDEKCLEFHKQNREINTASQWQVRQPIYKTSLERWKRYDKHIGELKVILAGLY